MFYDKDNKIFFKDFGEDAYDLNYNKFRVIFDDYFNESNPFSSNMSVNGRDISIQVQTSDIKKLELKNRSQIVVRDQTYLIKNIKVNKDGISDILLQIDDED